jgi:hypothetical protein
VFNGFDLLFKGWSQISVTLPSGGESRGSGFGGHGEIQGTSSWQLLVHLCQQTPGSLGLAYIWPDLLLWERLAERPSAPGRRNDRVERWHKVAGSGAFFERPYTGRTRANRHRPVADGPRDATSNETTQAAPISRRAPCPSRLEVPLSSGCVVCHAEVLTRAASPVREGGNSVRRGASCPSGRGPWPGSSRKESPRRGRAPGTIGDSLHRGWLLSRSVRPSMKDRCQQGLPSSSRREFSPHSQYAP